MSSGRRAAAGEPRPAAPRGGATSETPYAANQIPKTPATIQFVAQREAGVPHAASLARSAIQRAEWGTPADPPADPRPQYR